jgi:hypothetical protein
LDRRIYLPEGTGVWSNYPRRRTDGRMLPNVRGLITTQDGASILFEFRERTIFEGDEPGRQNLSAGSSPITKPTVG